MTAPLTALAGRAMAKEDERKSVIVKIANRLFFISASF
jgi:hypothetical protein